MSAWRMLSAPWALLLCELLLAGAVQQLEGTTVEAIGLIRRADWKPRSSLVDDTSHLLDRSQRTNATKTTWRPSERILGLESWEFASVVCLFSSVFVVCGFMLQKMGAATPGSYHSIGFIVLSPTWLAGFFLIAVASAFGDYWSFSLAPLSLIAPLSGITVVLNLVLAPVVLGEQLQPWPDVPASFLIFVGSVVSTSTGAHKETLYSADELVQLAMRPINVGSYLLLVAVSFGCALYAHLERASMEKSAQQRPLNPDLMHVLLPAITAATAGSLTNVHLKAEAELIKSRAPPLYCFAGLLFILVFAAVQLNFVNRGLQLYMQTVFLPVYSSLLVLGCTVYGAVFYQEYQELLAHGGKPFVAGIMMILMGIALFTKRKPIEGLSSRYGSI